MENNTREVKGIWIPIDIWKNKELNWNEKLLLLEIDSYSSKDKDCYISDEYIAKFLGIAQTNANKVLSSLIKKGYVIKTRFDGRRRYVKAALTITSTLTCQERQVSRACDNIDNNNIITNNNLPKEENNNKLLSKKASELDLSRVENSILPIIQKWLDYKKEKKQTYKQRGFDTLYKNLIAWSGGDAMLADAIVEKSMMNNYAGLFPLRKDEIESLQSNILHSQKDELLLQKFYDILSDDEEADIYGKDRYSWRMLTKQQKDYQRRQDVNKQKLLAWIKEHNG